MATIQEPRHYIRFCADRELSDEEIGTVADIIYDQLEDMVTDDEVIAHENDLGQYCYVFTLNDDIVTASDGTFAGDSISDDIMDSMPEDLEWTIEASLPDQTIDVPEDATDQQVQEAAMVQVQRFLFG